MEEDSRDALTDEDYMQHALQEFNKNRKIIVKNVPPVSYDEVKEFLGGYAVADITISKKFRHAVVTMLRGEEAENAVDELRKNPMLLGTEVQIELHHNDNLMCVSHLPFNITEESFNAEMRPYGTIERCFLMKFNDTGKSKGYGFVEYVHNKEKSEEACQQLNGRRLGSCILQCSFVAPSVVRFEQLQSCCLLIDHLPIDYGNLDELKELCGCLVEPTYCKLGEKEDRMLGFGLVEYASWQDAERTQLRINGHQVASHSVRVTFCMPGKDVAELYDEIVEIRHQRLTALKTPLPKPLMSLSTPTPAAFTPQNITSPVIKRLLAQNTIALTNFAGVLQALQGEIFKQQMSLRPGLLGSAPSLASPLMNPDLQIALLAVLLAQQVQTNQPQFVENPNTQQYILNNLNNRPTAGAQMGARPSLLGNPYIAQANTMLSNIKSKDTKVKPEEIKTEESTSESTQPNSASAGLSLFPQTDQELSTTDLANFNQLLTTLNTPPSNRFRQVTAHKPPIKEEIKQEVKPDPPSMGDGLLGAPPGSQPENMDTKSGSMEGGASNPFFHIPGVSGANPFLATFIEQQIRSHINMGNQLNMFGAAMQMKNQAQQQTSSLMGSNAPPPLMGGATSLLGEPPSHSSLANNMIPKAGGGDGLLGAAPTASDAKPPSLLGLPLQGTPTSWNKMGQTSNSGATFGKRQLTYDKTTAAKVPSLLGEPPKDTAYEIILKQATGRNQWQEFCKGLTNQPQDENAQQIEDGYQDSNASDGQPSAKRVRPLLETPVEPPAPPPAPWSNEGTNAYAQWQKQYSGYSQGNTREDYEYNMKVYHDYCKKYQEQCENYWKNQGAAKEGNNADEPNKAGNRPPNNMGRPGSQRRSEDQQQGYDQQQQWGYGWGAYDQGGYENYDHYGGYYGYDDQYGYGYDGQGYDGYDQDGYGYYGYDGYQQGPPGPPRGPPGGPPGGPPRPPNGGKRNAAGRPPPPPNEVPPPAHPPPPHGMGPIEKSNYTNQRGNINQTGQHRNNGSANQSNRDQKASTQGQYQNFAPNSSRDNQNDVNNGKPPSLMGNMPQNGSNYRPQAFGNKPTGNDANKGPSRQISSDNAPSLMDVDTRYGGRNSNQGGGSNQVTSLLGQFPGSSTQQSNTNTNSGPQSLLGAFPGMPQSNNPSNVPSLLGEYAGKQSGGQSTGVPSLLGPLPIGSKGGLMPPPANTDVHRTPGQRPPHLLPSPEPSPDTAYVGQHSQGIGGHYADSYAKKGT